MYALLNNGLHSPRGLVRKGSALLLLARKQLITRPPAADYAATPPVLANSFPKSGTHLLDQIVAGLPDRVNYGAFLSSMTSSFQYRRRTSKSTLRFIKASLPGEIVRAHLFFDPQFDAALDARNVVHYFIYRDPARRRDIDEPLFAAHVPLASALAAIAGAGDRRRRRHGVHRGPGRRGARFAAAQCGGKFPSLRRLAFQSQRVRPAIRGPRRVKPRRADR